MRVADGVLNRWRRLRYGTSTSARATCVKPSLARQLLQRFRAEPADHSARYAHTEHNKPSPA